jgi:hypothetical protein
MFSTDISRNIFSPVPLLLELLLSVKGDYHYVIQTQIPGHVKIDSEPI